MLVMLIYGNWFVVGKKINSKKKKNLFNHPPNTPIRLPLCFGGVKMEGSGFLPFGDGIELELDICNLGFNSLDIAD